MKNYERPISGQDNPSRNNSPDSQKMAAPESRISAESSALPAARDNSEKYDDDEWKIIGTLMSNPTLINKVRNLLPNAPISPIKDLMLRAIIANQDKLVTPKKDPLIPVSPGTAIEPGFTCSAAVLWGHLIDEIHRLSMKGKYDRTALIEQCRVATKILKSQDFVNAGQKNDPRSWPTLVRKLHAPFTAKRLDELNIALRRVRHRSNDGDILWTKLQTLRTARIALQNQIRVLETILGKLRARPIPTGDESPLPAGVQSPKRPSLMNLVANLETLIPECARITKLNKQIPLLKFICEETKKVEDRQEITAKKVSSWPKNPIKNALDKKLVLPMDDNDGLPLWPSNDNNLAMTATAGFMLTNSGEMPEIDGLDARNIANVLGTDFEHYSNLRKFLSMQIPLDETQLVALVTKRVRWCLYVQRSGRAGFYEASEHRGKLELSAITPNKAALYALPISRLASNATAHRPKKTAGKPSKTFPYAEFVWRYAIRPVGDAYHEQAQHPEQIPRRIREVLADQPKEEFNSEPLQLTKALRLAFMVNGDNPDRVVPPDRVVGLNSLNEAWGKSTVRFDSIHEMLNELEIGALGADMTGLAIMQDPAGYRKIFVVGKHGGRIFFIDPATAELDPPIIQHILKLERSALGIGRLPASIHLLRLDARPNLSRLFH